MRRSLFLIGGVVFLAVAALFGFLLYVLLASGDPTYWAGDIAAFEKLDVSNPPPRNAVLFVGDSTVRHWDSLAADMAPITIIRRGFGGAQIAHVTYYIPRIVAPYRPAAIVLIAGEADLSDEGGRRPEDVLDDFKAFVAAVRKAQITAPVYFVSIHPQPMRSSRWLGAKRANALIDAAIRGDPSLHYIDIASVLSNGADKANDDYFRWDGLSLNAKGYALMTARIKAVLLAAGYGQAPGSPLR
jgi:lysophospholipase L1-like esterase